MEDQENLNVWKLYLLRKTSSRRKMSDKEMSCWEEKISGFTYKWYVDMFMKKVACCFEAILTRINENDSTWLQFLSTYRSKHQNTLFHFRQPKSCYTKHFSLETRTIDAWKACKHISLWLKNIRPSTTSIPHIFGNSSSKRINHTVAGSKCYAGSIKTKTYVWTKLFRLDANILLDILSD